MRVGTLIGLVALSMPGLARAGSVEVGPYSGLFLASAEHELFDSAAGQYAKFSTPGVTIGGRVGILPLDFLGAEAEVEASPIGTSGNGTAAIIGWRAQAIALIPRDGLEPFWVVGIGNLGVLSAPSADGNDVDAEFHVGTGVRYHLGDHLLIRGDLRDILSAQRGTEHGVANHFGVNVGVSFALKKVVAVVDTDGDGINDDVDTCVSAPETINGLDDADGCPDTLAPVAAVAATVPESITTDPPNAAAMVWIPHPFCRFVPAAEAKDLLAQLLPGDEVQVLADGYLPMDVPLALGETKVSLVPATPTGALVVVAWPRDEVTVAGTALAIDDDGIGIVDVPEGAVDVRIRGGGRDEVFPAYVPTGHAVWLRVPPPKTQIIRFRVGTSELDKQSIAAITGLAAQTGQYRLYVQGSASPEGDADANLKLAARRAEMCRSKLLEGGIPANRIDLGPPTIGVSTGLVDDLRSCILHPTADVSTK